MMDVLNTPACCCVKLGEHIAGNNSCAANIISQSPPVTSATRRWMKSLLDGGHILWNILACIKDREIFAYVLDTEKLKTAEEIGAWVFFTICKLDISLFMSSLMTLQAFACWKGTDRIPLTLFLPGARCVSPFWLSVRQCFMCLLKDLSFIQN